MNKRSLLILDSDEDVAKNISIEAEALGFEVKTFNDPKLFIDEFFVWNPSHLAIDLAMPAIHGIEVLISLVKLKCESHIILVSGLETTIPSAAQLIATENNLNVSGILSRPLNIQRLKNLLSGSYSEEDAQTYSGNADHARFIADEASIHHAIQNNQFVLYYQPQIDLPSGKATGLEGLIRWRHPEFGMKLPDSFIPVAERTGQIDQLMQIVINTAFEFMSKLDSELSFSINISAINIQDPHVIETLKNACLEHNIKPERVVLDLTETATMRDPVQTGNILQQLRAIGFRIGMDDVATSYASMDQLTKLPLSELKLDKSCVTTMDCSSKSRKVIASTIKLAENLGLSTIAKGIENSLAAIGLRELGCRLGQGYYFAKPMDQDATLVWLKNWNQQF